MDTVLQQFFDLVFIYGISVFSRLEGLLQNDIFVMYFGVTSLLLAGFAIYNAPLQKALEDFTRRACLVSFGVSVATVLLLSTAFALAAANHDILTSWKALTPHQRNMFVQSFTISLMVITGGSVLFFIVWGTKRLVESLGLAIAFLMFFFDDGTVLEESLRLKVLLAIALIFLVSVFIRQALNTSKNKRQGRYPRETYRHRKRSLERYRQKQITRSEARKVGSAHIKSK